MKALKIWKLAAMLVSILLAVTLHSEGMALPWPFPWAKECPVDWQSMQGRYRMSDSADSDRLEILITPIGEYTFKMVKVTHFGYGGTVIASGTSFVIPSQRSLSLVLYPSLEPTNNGPSLRAHIKLHYAGVERADLAPRVVEI